MPKPSHYPNHPVRVLRKLLGFPSANAFAQFTGIPAETIRNLEQGRRAVTERVARQIGIATGVSPSWLTAGKVARGGPRDVFGSPLTKEAFEKFRGVKARLAVDLNFGDERVQIEDQCAEIALLLRAAARRGRLHQCCFVLRMAIRDAKKEFGLTKAVEAETTPEIDARFHTSTTFGDDDDLQWGDFYNAWRLLSETAKFRWDQELAEKDSESSLLLDDIDSLRDVVAASFDVPKQPKHAMRKEAGTTPAKARRRQKKRYSPAQKRRA